MGVPKPGTGMEPYFEPLRKPGFGTHPQQNGQVGIKEPALRVRAPGGGGVGDLTLFAPAAGGHTHIARVPA